ncbi:MAG TPA: TIGR02679 family protein [Streptosporangiaceae bacterium]|jgi:uncharacterized protein (TIGR02679 family)|nr:TIGR02679 family protein [Streptosporangiaceae bacterium]
MNAPSSPIRRPPDPGGTSDGDRQRLQRMLGAPELSWLVDRIRVRLERGEPVDGTVTLVGATADQRRAAARLLGHGMGRGTSLSIPLPEVEAALRRAAAAPDLRAAVESLIGPVRDRAAERATEVRQFQDGLDAARRSPLAAEGWHLAWLEEISRDGSLSRLARHGHGNLLAQATAVLERLPTGIDEPAAALPALAEAVTGDPKALEGTPLAGLVLRALARREGVPAPAGREAERALWTAAGVVADDLASQVLVLNIRAGGDRLGGWLTEAAEAGEPFRITLHQLMAMPIIPLAIDLRVCENPAVLRAAAGQLGADSAPIVCTEGEPSVACHRLLQYAEATGTRIHWHSDFDWPGLRITAAAVRRLNAAPWLMGAADYEAALQAGSEPLKGQPAASPWDPRLAELMQSSGRAVTEENHLAALLADLAGAPGLR